MSPLTSLTNLLDLEVIRAQLGPTAPLLAGLPLAELGQKIFIRGLRSRPNSAGDGVTYTLELVILDGLAIEIPGSSFQLAVNPTAPPLAPSAFPLSLTYQLPALRYLDDEELAFLDGSAAAYYQFLLQISGAAPAELLTAVLELIVDDDDPLQAFLDQYGAVHGPLSLAIDPDPVVAINEIAAAILAAGVDLQSFLYNQYLAVLPQLAALEALATLFHRWFEFSPGELQELVTPFYSGTLHDLQLRLQFPRALLRPLKSAAQEAANIAPGVAVGEPLPEPFQSEVSFQTSAIQLNSQLGLDFSGIAGVAFSDSEIAQTGLQLSIDTILLDFSTSRTPAAVLALGFTNNFKGVYARQARVRWLKQLQIPGLAVPGVSMEIAELAIGNEGLALRLAANWAIDDADPFGPGSALVGNLPGGWGVALAAATGRFLYQDGELSQTWHSDLSVSGLLQLPFWTAVFDVRFGLQVGNAGASTQLEVTHFNSPLVIPLGDDNQLIFDALSAQGTLADDGSFTLGGSARGGLDIGLPGLQLLQASFDVPTLTLAHNGATSTMQLAGIFNAQLFAGTPFAAHLQNVVTTLQLEAAGATIQSFSLDLADFSADLQLTEKIAIHIADCLLDLNPHGSPQAILDYGFDDSFMGLLSRHTILSWTLPGVVFEDDLELGAVIVGNAGVGLAQTWSAPPTAVLFGDWAVGLTTVDGLLVFDENGSSHLELSGFIEIPLFNAPLTIRFFLQSTPAGQEIRVALSATDIAIDLGPAGALALANLTLEGSLNESGMALFGYVGGGSLTLTNLGDTFSLGEATISFNRQGSGFEMELDVSGLDIPLGENDTLSFGSRFLLAGDESGLQKIVIAGAANWEDIDFAPLPPFMPQPAADAALAAELQWAAVEWQLTFSAALSDVDLLFSFLSPAFRPQTKDATFELHAAQQTAAGGFQAEARLGLSLRLPDLAGLPGAELFRIDSGDPDGWLRLELVGGVEDDGSGAVPYMRASLENPLTVALNLPGLPLPRPPIETAISAVEFELSGDSDSALVGGFALVGDFILRPLDPADIELPIPPAMTAHMERLFRAAGIQPLGGSAEISLAFAGEQAMLSLRCIFTAAGLELDIFDMLANVTQGLGQLAGVEGESTIDLDIEIGFAPREINLTLGSLDPEATANFDMSMLIGLSAAGAQTDFLISFSAEAFSFGFTKLNIPIALPHLPLERTHLDALRDPQGQWDYTGVWLAAIEPDLNVKIELANEEIAQIGNLISGLEQILFDSDDPSERAAAQIALDEARFEQLPQLQLQAFDVTARKLLIEAILAVHQLVNEENRPAYQAMVETYQEFLDNTLGVIQLDSGLNFEINNARFILPFDDPSNIAVEGGARLTGFDHEWLKPLEALFFRLGLSAEAVYFAVEGGGEPINIPPVGRYSGGAVDLKHIRIGYGYSKNSFHLAFAGALTLPPALIEDADTSDLLGAGLRLPHRTRLAFNLDLIPVVLGEVDFIIPLFKFDLDMRDEGLPGIIDSRGCIPAWDGLQLIIPGLFRADVKRMRYAPFFGPLPAPNVTYSYDYAVGNDQAGFNFVCDNYLLITPILGYYPLPLLADNIPFFDNLCVNIQLAGFGINFNLQRPFPSMSPMALFELLGLIADPLLQIDPDGQLASTIRASIKNGTISLPPAIVGMFPEAGPLLRREINHTVNLATVITIAQQLAHFFEQAITLATEQVNDAAELIAALQANPPDLSPGGLLSQLPPALRRFSLRGAFVGFEASAYFFLLTPEEALDAFERRDVTAVPPEHYLALEENFASSQLAGWQAIQEGFSGNGLWQSGDGILRQTQNLGNNARPQYGPLFIYEAATFADFSLHANLSSSDNDGIGLLFHFQDWQNYYRFRMTSEQGYWLLTRIVNGRAHTLHRSNSQYEIGREYHVTINVSSEKVPLAPHFQTAPIKLPGIRPPADHKPPPRADVAIQIIVDGQVWCELTDAGSILPSGHIGLCCWWNSGAQFRQVRLYNRRRGWLKDGQFADPALFKGFTPNIAADPHPVQLLDQPGQSLISDNHLLDAFSSADIAFITPELDAAEGAILVGAKVQVFGDQIFGFLGFINANGAFSLATSLEIKPLVLEVAGISVELQLEVAGRLLLRGQNAGAHSWAEVTARLYGVWHPFPLLPDLLVLVLAGRDKPATLSLSSNGNFSLIGAGGAALFGAQLLLEGALDISQSHCLLSGKLSYQSPFIIDEQPLLELEIASEGSIGPGVRFSLSGEGSLAVLGQPFNSFFGRVDETGMSLKAELGLKTSEQWTIGGIPLFGVNMALRGRLDFPQGTPPDLDLAGAARLTLFGATIDGEGGIKAGGDYWCIFAAGALRWLDREWLSGAIRVCADEITVSGWTSFSLDMTQLPTGVDLAGLYLNINLGGSFTLRTNGNLFGCNLEIEAGIGVRFPGNEDQLYPLMQKAFSLNLSNLGSNPKLLDLFEIAAINLLPIGDLTVPIPVFSGDEATNFYFYPLPIPRLVDEPENDDDPPVFTLPGLGSKSISGAMSGLGLSLSLAWDNNEKLGIKIAGVPGIFALTG